VRVSSPFFLDRESSQFRPIRGISAQRAERKRFSHRRMFAGGRCVALVNEEVKVFREQGKPNEILCLVVGGEPLAAEARLFRGTRMLSPACSAPLIEGQTGVEFAAEPLAADLRPERRSAASARLRLLRRCSVSASMNCVTGITRGNGGVSSGGIAATAGCVDSPRWRWRPGLRAEKRFAASDSGSKINDGPTQPLTF